MLKRREDIVSLIPFLPSVAAVTDPQQGEDSFTSDELDLMFMLAGGTIESQRFWGKVHCLFPMDVWANHVRGWQCICVQTRASDALERI